MSLPYFISPAADADLDELAAYLARVVGNEAAFRFHDSAASTFEAIGRMPGLGERWESSKPRLAELRVRRVSGFENHLVFYRPTEAGIVIVRVLHGARDISGAIESGKE